MAIRKAMAGVAVKDLEVAIAFWTRLLDNRAPNRPMSEVAEYAMGPGSVVQLFRDAARAGYSSVTLVVESLERETARLRGLGIEVGKPTRNAYADTAIVHDPEGNQVVLVEPKAASNSAQD